MDAPLHFEIPRPAHLARHVVPHLLEATFVPLAIFYAFFWLSGVWAALFAGLVWSWGAVVRRLVTGRRVPGILAIGATLVTVRTLVAVASHSTYVYFLQPTLGTVAVAAAFLLSVPAGRPLAGRLAHDFCPIPESLSTSAPMQRFFTRISVLWGVAYCVNATVTFWLLMTQSVETYVWAKSFVSLFVTGGAIVLSTALFAVSMRRHGVRVRFAPRLVPVPAAV